MIQGIQHIEVLNFKGKWAQSTIRIIILYHSPGSLGGRSVGAIANNLYCGACALDAECCEKVTRFLVLCDSFNIPLVILVDTPGFLIGKAGEYKRLPASS